MLETNRREFLYNETWLMNISSTVQYTEYMFLLSVGRRLCFVHLAIIIRFLFYNSSGLIEFDPLNLFFRFHNIPFHEILL